MGRKKTGAMLTDTSKREKKMVIDMTKVELAKSYMVPNFRTGKHMAEKDRPRKKNWKKEYSKQLRELGYDYKHQNTDLFYFH